MLKMGVGRNSLNVYLSFDGFLRRVFSLLRAGEILDIYSSGLKALVLLVQDSISLLHPESWYETRPICSRRHLSSKLIFLFPISADGKGGYFRFRILANHLAFFLSFPAHRVQTPVGFHSVGDPFGLLSLSPEWGYGVQIAWPIFFSSFNGRPELTYILYFSFNAQSLAASEFKHGG